MHGINNKKNSEDTLERSLNDSVGGELGKTIQDLVGKLFTCTCKRNIKLGSNFIGYPHDGGLADNLGSKWWLYVECPKCGYGWSWRKIEGRIDKQ